MTLRFFGHFSRDYLIDSDIAENREKTGQSEQIGKNAVFGGSQRSGRVNYNHRPDQAAAELRNAQPEDIFCDGLAKPFVFKKKRF